MPDQSTDTLDAKQLHAHARAGTIPDEFTAARERLDEAVIAAERAREGFHDLIREADALGVRTGTLAEWTGYSLRRTYQIRTGEEA